MENQHRKIKGYRELSQEEIDLMNEIKQKGVELSDLLERVKGHVNTQYNKGVSAYNEDQSSPVYAEGDAEINRLEDAEPHRWLAIAKTDLQTGLMALTRVVGQPEFF